MISVKLTTQSPELIEDMGEWEVVNCTGKDRFTLNKYTDRGFTARIVYLKPEQVLVISEGKTCQQ